MPKFYIKWQLDSAKIPGDMQEATKSWLSMLEMVKADRKAGLVKDWGAAAGGMSGYSIMEATNESEAFTSLLKWMPYVQFEVIPALTVDQTIASIKKAAAAAKK